jgi:hypothetical protein
VEDVGVAVAELLGDLESPAAVVEDRGDAVPELLASFFFEDLLESFARDSCSCWACQQWYWQHELKRMLLRKDRINEQHTTLCLKPFISKNGYCEAVQARISRNAQMWFL